MENNITTASKKQKNNSFTYAIGRRKQATARIRLYKDIKADIELKKGDIVVNNKKIDEYFPGEIAKVYYMEPFHITDSVSKFAVTIRVSGGGSNSQMDAVVLGISRALVKFDDKNKVDLRKRGLLTTDARVKERRKVGTGGKARRKKQSPKR